MNPIHIELSESEFRFWRAVMAICWRIVPRNIRYSVSNIERWEEFKTTIAPNTPASMHRGVGRW